MTPGYLPDALFNFLALLGWAPDGETTMHVARRDRRALLARPGRRQPATFDYQKLDWLNGVYLRALQPDELRRRARRVGCASRGCDWDEERVRAAAPLVQEKIARLGEFPAFAGFLFGPVEPDPALLDGGGPRCWRRPRPCARRRRAVRRRPIEAALKAVCERLGLKPRQAFQPIRVAVTGSKVSPGLYESLELLGKDESLRRLSAASRWLAKRPRARQRVQRALEDQPGRAPERHRRRRQRIGTGIPLEPAAMSSSRSPRS